MGKYCCWFLLLSCSPLLPAQQADLDNLVEASARLRESKNPVDIRSIAYRSILRDYIESRLPSNATALDEQFPALEIQLNAELERAGVLPPKTKTREVGIELIRPADFPEALLIEATLPVPCGADASVFVYRYTGASRVRLLEAGGAGAWGSNLVNAQFSAPDVAGNRIFFTAWNNVQCESNWNELEFQLYRIAPDSENAAKLLSASHTYTTSGELNIKLSTGELLLEFEAEALEGGFRRTHILRYSIEPEGVARIDPVALLPQDFVHEWLERPWSEMASRSAEEVEKWHKFLQGVRFTGEYGFVQPCQEHPDFTQVSVAITSLGEQDVPEPLLIYFLVEDKGQQRFTMSDVSFDRQPGCREPYVNGL